MIDRRRSRIDNVILGTCRGRHLPVFAATAPKDRQPGPPKDEMMEEFTAAPIGVVHRPPSAARGKPDPTEPSWIQVFPEFVPALTRIHEHSHLWILCWFHRADRSAKVLRPSRINPTLPPYGVFGLRSPARPNPIALSLVRLDRVEGDTLHVGEFDAAAGTPVLDIKPYFESDIIFSPRTPYIRPIKPEVREALFRKQALLHHGEACAGLELGIKMALLADELLGQIQNPNLVLHVQGSRCLADTLQGLTRARLANPPRFTFTETEGPSAVTWTSPGPTATGAPVPKTLRMAAQPDSDRIMVE